MLRRILFASALAIAGLVLAAPAGASAAGGLSERQDASASPASRTGGTRVMRGVMISLQGH